MLKHPGGTDAAMCVPDDRPRKKLSFREPEVVNLPRNSGQAASLQHPHEPVSTHHTALHHPPPPPHHHHQTHQHHHHNPGSLHHPPPPPHHHHQTHQHHHHNPGSHHHHHPHTRHNLGRPHSIAGIVGLGGFSALGVVQGVTSMTSTTANQSVVSQGTVSGVTSMLGNPGLLSHPSVIPIPPTPVLTPHISPLYTANTHLASASQYQTPASQQSPAAKTVFISSSTSNVKQSSPQSIYKVCGSQATSPVTKMPPPHQPTSPTIRVVSNPLAPPSPKNPVSHLPHHHHQGRAGSLQPSSGKSLPPSGIKSPGGAKPTKPASRNSSLKKARSPPVHQAVTFLTDEGIVNGRNRSHCNKMVNSLEDIDLESQAMRVVRTVGQAFEVCHKISVKDTPQSQDSAEDEASEQGSDVSTEKLKKDLLDTESTQEDLVTLTPSDSVNEDSVESLLQRPNKLQPLAPPAGSDILLKGAGETYTSPLSEPLPSGDSLPIAGTPLSVHHELQLLREQLEQQQQQTQAAVSQVHLLRDQLAAETAARLEAQARTHQLLVHNKELLEHIQALVLQVRELELKMAGNSNVMPTTQLLPSPLEIKSQLLVNDASPGHTSQLAAALDLGGTASLLFHSPELPPTPSPSIAHHQFLYPSPPLPTHLSSLSEGPSSGPQESITVPRSNETKAQSLCMGPLIHPLPLWGEEDEHAVPQQEPSVNSKMLQGVPRPRTGQRPEECSSTPSLSSESDLKRDSSGQSSGESVTQAVAQLYGQSSGESVTQAVAQLYALEPHRLDKVPEDAVTLGPYGLTPLGAPRNLNGPITRTASERVSRQETLAQLQRMAWARHTTK